MPVRPVWRRLAGFCVEHAGAAGARLCHRPKGTMVTMLLRRIARFTAVSSVAILLAVSVLSAQEPHHRGRKYKAPPPTSRVDVTVLRSDDDRPRPEVRVLRARKAADYRQPDVAATCPCQHTL